MPFDLFDALGFAADVAGDVPVPRNRRERPGCLIGLCIVGFVAILLLLVSLT